MEIKVSGLTEVQRHLAEAPKNIVILGFANALNKAAGVFAGAVEQSAELLEPSGSQTRLCEHIIVKVEVDINKPGGVALIGFDKSLDERTGVPQDLKALWVEFGHILVGHKPGKKVLDASPVKPTPFMRVAFQVYAADAVEAFIETLRTSLEGAHL